MLLHMHQKCNSRMQFQLIVLHYSIVINSISFGQKCSIRFIWEKLPFVQMISCRLANGKCVIHSTKLFEIFVKKAKFKPDACIAQGFIENNCTSDENHAYATPLQQLCGYSFRQSLFEMCNFDFMSCF